MNRYTDKCQDEYLRDALIFGQLHIQFLVTKLQYSKV